MKIPRLANAVGNLDDDLIEAAAACGKKLGRWARWASLAACLAVLVIAGALMLPALLEGELPPGGTDNRYKDILIQAGELAMEWPWEYKTVYERYTEVTVDGIVYRSKGRPVSAELVGDLIGTCAVTGIDYLEGDRYTEEFEVYCLKYAHRSQFVAVKMEGTCYVFKKDGYEPPRTLGELFELVALPQAVELNRFSVNGDGTDKKYFALHDDAYLWEVLSGCENAPFVEDAEWFAHDRAYYSFTVTSQTLGIYKVALYITEDGYLWTNAFDHQYLFDIGAEAAGSILRYAAQNSTEAAYEPYQNTIVGQITQITDGYLLLDDSVLCEDPADGITYQILLNDPRISRYVQSGALRVGENIQITYTGEIDQAHTIDSAISATGVILSDKAVLIPE